MSETGLSWSYTERWSIPYAAADNEGLKGNIEAVKELEGYMPRVLKTSETGPEYTALLSKYLE